MADLGGLLPTIDVVYCQMTILSCKPSGPGFLGELGVSMHVEELINSFLI